MTNADKFKEIFGLYATELWAKSYKEFSDWLNADVPETNVGDTISRQAAIDKFEPWLKVKGYSDGELNMLNAVLYELRFLPSAQPEPRWIPVKTRPMDEEERKYYLEELGWSLDDNEAVMFDSLMPGDGQEVWVCSK